jgi:DNA-binding CsgD family transcriptional regulator/tetratricopeptide (TPR) repeat protein
LREGDSFRWLSRFSYIQGEREAADRYGETAVALLQPLPSSPELAMAMSNFAQLTLLAGRIGESLPQAAAAVGLAEQLNRPDIVCHGLNTIGTANMWLDVHKGRTALDRSLAIALEHDLPEHAARAFVNRSFAELHLLDYRQAMAILTAGIAYCSDHDLGTWHDHLRAYLAELHLRQGRWDEAAENALPVVTNDGAAPLVRFPAVMALAKLRLRRGDPSTDELFAELQQFMAKGMEPQRLVPYAALMAERAWLGQGDTGEALDLLDRAERASPMRPVLGEVIFWRQKLAPGSLPEDAGSTATPYRTVFAGDWQTASIFWENLDAPYDQGLALLHGDEDAQRKALVLFESLGAGPVAAHVRTILRRNGVDRLARGPHRRTRANLAGLTERQMDVLRLIVRGFSNKTIANHLAISPKTVDHHVSAVLGKLDAGSRGEATAVALDSGLV